MNGFRLGVLLRLRRQAADEALRVLGAAVTAVHAAERERERLRTGELSLRRRAAEVLPIGDAGALRMAALLRTRLRNEAQEARERVSLQDLRLLRAEAAVETTRRSLALARAEYEVLASRHRRWMEGRRFAREGAEEREVEEWVCAGVGRNLPGGACPLPKAGALPWGR